MTRGHIFGSEPRVQIRLSKDQVHSKIFFNSKKTAQMKLDKVIEKDNSLGEQMNGRKKRVSIDFVSNFWFKRSLLVLFLSEL